MMSQATADKKYQIKMKVKEYGSLYNYAMSGEKHAVEHTL